MGNARYLGLLVAVFVPLMASMALGASVSAVNFNETHLTILPNSTTVATYSVDLINGTSGPTNFTINNLRQLVAEGISVNASDYSGYPGFSGLLTIKVGKDALPGNYSVIATATGSDPSMTSNALPFTIPGNTSSSVPAPSGGKGRSPTNSSRSGTSGAVTLYTTSTLGAGPTSRSAGQPSVAQLYEWLMIAAAAIIVFIIVVFMAFRMGKKPKA